jgi:hypothetical protein
MLLMLSACSTQSSGSSDQDQSPDEPPQEVTQDPGKTVFDLIAAFEASGASVEPAGDISQPFFSVTGKILSLNGTEIQFFEYADAESAMEESKLIASDGGSVGTTMMTWIDVPHFYLKEQAIVLYVGSDENTTGLLADVLGPQIAGGEMMQTEEQTMSEEEPYTDY